MLLDIAALLFVCLPFHNCIVTCSVSCYEKRVRCNLQHMLHADRHLSLIMDLGGMASSSGCQESPQHVGRHMLLWVNLIDWMAPNSQVQVSSGSQRVNPSEWRMSWGVGLFPLIDWHGLPPVCLWCHPQTPMGASWPHHRAQHDCESSVFGNVWTDRGTRMHRDKLIIANPSSVFSWQVIKICDV